jgi:hypothetical protein
MFFRELKLAAQLDLFLFCDVKASFNQLWLLGYIELVLIPRWAAGTVNDHLYSTQKVDNWLSVDTHFKDVDKVLWKANQVNFCPSTVLSINNLLYRIWQTLITILDCKSYLFCLVGVEVVKAAFDADRQSFCLG